MRDKPGMRWCSWKAGRLCWCRPQSWQTAALQWGGMKDAHTRVLAGLRQKPQLIPRQPGRGPRDSTFFSYAILKYLVCGGKIWRCVSSSEILAMYWGRKRRVWIWLIYIVIILHCLHLIFITKKIRGHNYIKFFKRHEIWDGRWLSQ